MAFSLFRQIPTWASAAALVAVLAACSGPSKPVPKDLGANIGLIGVKTAWSAQLGAMESSAQPHVVGSQVLLASAKGIVTALQGETGSVAWQLDVGTPLVSGVGSDGQTAVPVADYGALR